VPVAIPALVAAGYAAATGTVIFGLSVAMSATLIGIGTLAASLLQTALTPKPKRPGMPFSDISSARTTQVKEPVTERRITYGECKLSGPINYFGSTESNKYLHLVITLATHECQAIQTVWFNNDPIHTDDIDSGGNVIAGKYAGGARIKKHLGQPGQVVDPDLLAEIAEIKSTFVGNSICYIYVRLKKDDVLYKSGLPNVQVWLQGAKLLDLRDGTTSWSPNPALCLYDYYLHTKYGMSTPARKFLTSNVTATANSCDEMVPTKPVVHAVTAVAINGSLAAPTGKPLLAIGSAGNIGGNRRDYVVTFTGAGGVESPPSPIATIAIPSQNSRVNLTAIPLGGAGVTGRKIYRNKGDYLEGDPSNVMRLLTTIADNATTTYTDNIKDEDLGDTVRPAGSLKNRLTLNGDILNFQIGDRVQLTTTGTLPTGISLLTNYYVIPVQIVNTLVIQLATSYQNALAGTAITITAAGSGTHTVTKNAEPRYTTNGTLGTSRQPNENIGDLLSAMAGSMIPVGGRWIMKAAVWVAPTIHFGMNDLCGALEITPKHSRRDRFNGLQGLYVTPANRGEPSDYPLVKDDSYVTEDGGQLIIAQLDLPMTSRSQMAQRIARVQLNRHRRQRTIQITTNLAGLQVQAADPFTFSHSNHNFVASEFEVSDFNLVPRSDKNGRPMLTCDIVAQQTDSAIYDFNELTQESTPQPPQSTVIGNPDDVVVPGSPTAVETKYVTTDGTGVKVRADISFTASTDFFVRQYEIEYRPQQYGEYLKLPPSLSNSAVIYDLAPGIYDLRVRAVSIFNAKSAYVYSTFTIVGLSDLPGDVQGFSVISVGDDAALQWVQTVDIDVKVSGWVRIRHTPLTVGYTWGNARDITPALPGIATHANVPLLDGTYMAKFVDSVGNESSDFAAVIVANTKIIKMNHIVTVTEDSTFAGTKSGVEVIASKLQLAGAGLFDDTAGDFDDALGDFDAGNGLGQVTTATYTFATLADAGKVTRCYLQSAITHEIFNSVEYFDSRSGDFDAALGLFEGESVPGISITFYVRTTSDDPAGTPTWGAWQPFIAGYFTARGFQFKIEIHSLDSSYQTEISALSVAISIPDTIDAGTVTTTSGALATFTFNETFTAAPSVLPIINDAQAGDIAVIPLANVTSSNFKAGVLNSGSYVVRSLTWFAKGH